MSPTRPPRNAAGGAAGRPPRQARAQRPARSPSEAPPPQREPGGEDALETLRERIRLAQEAAARVAEEAQATRDTAAADPRPPRNGFAATGRRGREDVLELQALAAVLDFVRGLIPRELQQQVAELVRELLLLLRALIDWYLERVAARRRAPVEVEDIPIS